MALKFQVIKTIGVLSEKKDGWNRELNLVSWNDRMPKYDIRDWNEDHTKMGKGIVLSNEDMLALIPLIQEINPEDLEN